MSNNYNLDVYKMSVISDDTEADIVLQDLEAEIEDKDRLIDIIMQEQSRLEDRMKDIEIQHEAKVLQHKNLIRNYIGTLKMKETKTQYTYTLPTAKLVRHKVKYDYAIADGDVVMADVESKFPEYIKTAKTVDWKALKNAIITLEGGEKCVVNEDGEMVPIAGIAIIEKNSGRTSIKFNGGKTYETEENT